MILSAGRCTPSLRNRCRCHNSSVGCTKLQRNIAHCFRGSDFCQVAWRKWWGRRSEWEEEEEEKEPGGAIEVRGIGRYTYYPKVGMSFSSSLNKFLAFFSILAFFVPLKLPLKQQPTKRPFFSSSVSLVEDAPTIDIASMTPQSFGVLIFHWSFNFTFL